MSTLAAFPYDNWELMEKVIPETVHALVPQRFTNIGKYPEQRWWALSFYSAARMVAKHCATQEQLHEYLLGCKLLENQVPTFFISTDLATALSKTKPPQQLKFSEMKWPMPVMRFMLTTEFSRAWLGETVNHMVIGQMKPGEYFQPSLGLGNELITRPCSTPVAPDAVMISTAVMAPQPDGTEQLSHYIDEPSYDSKVVDFSAGLSPDLHAPTFEKLRFLATNLICYMAAFPQVAPTPVLVRAAKHKKGRMLDALWEPHIIGASYHLQKQGIVQGGSHTSPRLHWRCGHWTHQPYGAGSKLRKIIWIEPFMVG